MRVGAVASDDAATPSRLASALLSVLVLLGGAAWSLEAAGPPAARGADAPATEFSAARAMRHVRELSREPRPMGVPAHARAREYLLGELRALGAEPTLQRTTGVSSWFPQAGSVTNVLARWPGTRGRGKAITLVSHYDGVAAGPAAADAGSGVAVVLETMRALRAGDPIANDVIVLITDGEEDGLLGAAAFTAEHPWKNDVGVLLNFEARGTAGAGNMFETAPRNMGVVRAFAGAAPRPVSSSLSYEIYKLLPNDTDFSEFRAAGLQGLNFAFIENVAHYHTPRDNPEALDPRSVQHEGDQAIAIVRHLADTELPLAANGDAAWFVLPGLGVVLHPIEWSLPLAMVAPAAVLALSALGLRRRQYGWKRLAIAIVAPLAALLAALASAWVQHAAIVRIHRTGRFAGLPNLAEPYLLATVAVAAAVTLATYRLARRWTTPVEIAGGILFWWSGLAVALAAYLPGASYLATVPALAAALALLATRVRAGGGGGDRHHSGSAARQHQTDWLAFALTLLSALITVALFSPLVTGMFDALGLVRAVALGVSAVVALSLWLLALAVEPLGRRGTMAAVAVLLGIGAFATLRGMYAARFSSDLPGKNEVVYLYDAAARQALWVDPRPAPSADPWTRRVIGDESLQRPLDAMGPMIGDRDVRTREAPPVALSAPVAELLADSALDGGERELRLRVRSTRGARMLFVDAPGLRATATSIAGRVVGRNARSGPERWRVEYAAPPDSGVVISVRGHAPRPWELRVADMSPGVPEAVRLPARPSWLVQYGSYDATVVARSFAF